MNGARGFTLLEVLVAFAIMGLALGALYRSLGGSVRATAAAEREMRAVLTAESLLAGHDAVPPGGLAAAGATADGFAWRLASAPYPLPSELAQRWKLDEIAVEVSWEEGGRRRSFRLASLRPELAPR